MSGKGRFQKFPPGPKHEDFRANKVEVQDGKIDPNPHTMKFKLYTEKVADRRSELDFMRYGQTLDLHEPKQ